MAQILSSDTVLAVAAAGSKSCCSGSERSKPFPAALPGDLERHRVHRQGGRGRVPAAQLRPRDRPHEVPQDRRNLPEGRPALRKPERAGDKI